ncbi:MAG: DUF169 domain-containing protein [Firmicutes bacterium]|nr:DUF169 domain-containing protein [Bacillota bacterium]
MGINKEAAAALEEHVRPASFPVAVKISEEESLPARARRPLKNLGHPATICQGISMARSIGWTVGFLKEDHACAPSFVVLGLAEEPEMVKSGDLVHPLYGETLESCARTQGMIPALPLGKARSIVVAPLAKAEFEPDVILVYGTPAQVARLIQGALYRRGGAVTSSFVGRNSCAGELVAPLLEQKCQVIVPGSGERLFALTQDHEMCFAIPRSCLEDVTAGLAATHKTGAMRFPTPFQGLRARPQYPEKYHRLEEMFGVK